MDRQRMAVIAAATTAAGITTTPVTMIETGISLRPDELFEKSKPSRQSQGGFILAVYFGMEDRLRADATFFLACS
jgi:hypothetical protein